jgi:hypothetical protein
MYECPQGLQLWLIERRTLCAPPPDAAYDYSLEPADAQLEAVKPRLATVRIADVDEAFGVPVRRLAAASAND